MAVTAHVEQRIKELKEDVAEIQTRQDELRLKFDNDTGTKKDVAEFEENLNKAQAKIREIKALEVEDFVANGGSGAPAFVKGVKGGWSPMRVSSLFDSAGEMFQAVAAAYAPPGVKIGGFDGGRVDDRIMQVQAAATGGSVGVPSDGGFLVGEELSNELLGSAFETGLLAPLVRRRTLTGPVDTYRANAYDETSRADGSRYGGIQSYWKGEAESLTGSKPKFRQLELKLGKLTGLYYATDELLQDSAALEQEIREAFASEFGFKIDDAILRGSGAGQPLGILNSPALVTQDKEGSQSADTIVTANISKMYARWLGSRRSGVWVTNRDTFPELSALALEVGTGGSAVGLLGGNAALMPYEQLLGMRLLEMEQASTLGDLGDVMLLDPSQYMWIDKGGVQSAVSIHVKFVEDEVVFRFIYRCDGQPIPNSAITPYKGANTRSPFVTLQART
jgi:HK97 family phage major capsid protein